MLKLFDEEHLSELRRGYLSSRLFCTLFPGLAELERIYGELPPSQVWHETEVYCAGRLIGSGALELEVIALWNSLLSRYSAFVAPDGHTVQRTPRKAEYTAVCVLTCVCFRLVAEPGEVATWHSAEAVKEILRLISRHPVHCHLYLAQRRREELLEQAGRPIEPEPWVDGVDSGRACRTGGRGPGEGFAQLFRGITLEQWTAFVERCEAEMTFRYRIDRMAYLVTASHKGWLKGPRTIRLSAWLELMNGLLGAEKRMQPAEVSRKWNEMKEKKFYQSALDMRDCTDFCSSNISSSFFKTLRENVMQMNRKYNN